MTILKAAAAALVAGALAMPALAQEMDDMQRGLTMLELSASRALDQYRIDAEPMSLTLSQLAEIYGILSS